MKNKFYTNQMDELRFFAKTLENINLAYSNWFHSLIISKLIEKSAKITLFPIRLIFVSYENIRYLRFYNLYINFSKVLAEIKERKLSKRFFLPLLFNWFALIFSILLLISFYLFTKNTALILLVYIVVTISVVFFCSLYEERCVGQRFFLNFFKKKYIINEFTQNLLKTYDNNLSIKDFLLSKEFVFNDSNMKKMVTDFIVWSEKNKNGLALKNFNILKMDTSYDLGDKYFIKLNHNEFLLLLDIEYDKNNILMSIKNIVESYVEEEKKRYSFFGINTSNLKDINQELDKFMEKQKRKELLLNSLTEKKVEKNKPRVKI